MISITVPFNKMLCIKGNRLKFKLENKNSYIKLFIYVMLTIGLIISITIDNGRGSSFYGIVGFILCILTLNYILRIINARSIFSKELNILCKKHENFIYTFEFLDDEFSYFDNEKRFHFKWGAFSSYSIRNDFFVLLIENKIFLMLHKSETSESQFNDIIELTKSKLGFKKV
ncbi:hypothetical protein ASE74_09315 [Pedobacter sp. Leaf216]|uniref:hypothetical protein n=1 Tax=Pedobacter sp. Leaf216 TaxID=1735684 RepID=UPI0006FC1749|nr:hypothetical protein [Pedobacter sp. Leaf216]KQM66079.1 hypothetical protein ASE74_09315 [Pedobacter sp. Leaf216]